MLRLLCVVMIFCLQLSGCTGGGTASLKEKRTLKIYSSVNYEDIGPLVEEFTQRTGIKVEVWKAAGSTVVTRVLEEKQASKLQGDLVLLNAQRMAILKQKKMLIPYRNQDAHDFCIQYLTVAYNKNLVPIPPRTYQDLLSPDFKGKLAMEIDSPEWEKGLLPYLGNSFFQELKTRLMTGEIRSIDGKRHLAELVVAGEIPIAINLGNNYIEQAKNKGAPVEWAPLEPVVACPQSAALLVANQDAEAFIDFLLSREGQILVKKVGRGSPVDKTIPSPLYTGFQITMPSF